MLQAVVTYHHGRGRMSGKQRTQSLSTFVCYKNRSSCRTLYKGWLVTAFFNRGG